MANSFSFEEALQPVPQPQQPQAFSFEEAFQPAAPASFSYEEAQTPWVDARTRPEAGFTGAFTSALGERFATAAPAAKLYFGIGDQQQASADILAAREHAANEYKQTEYGEIGDAFRQGKYGEALSKTYDKFKEVTGSSFGAMAPAMGAGAAAAAATAAAPVAIPAAAVGTAAFGITALASYLADNIGRQKEEQKKLGKEGEDIERLPATVAAAGQTALDIFGFRFFKPLGQLVGLEGRASANAAASEIIEAATRPGAYRRAVARGTAAGIAFEVPQEVAQQVLERWQAGLPTNPFTDPGAAREYLEAAGGALLMGGPMGAVSRVAETRTARKLAAGDTELDELDKRIKEELGTAAQTQEAAYVGQPAETVGTTTQPGAPVVEQRGAVPAGGIEAPVVGGVDVAGEPTERADVREAAQPTPLNAITPELETYEQAQAVIDSLPNPTAFMIQETDYGYVVTPRTAEPATSTAPAEMVGTTAPSPAVEPAAAAIEPSAAPAVAPAVEAQPAAPAVETVAEATPEEAARTEAQAEPATEVVTPEEETRVAQTPETVEAEAQRQEESNADPSRAASAIEQQAAEVAESEAKAANPTLARKDPEAHKAQMARNKAFTDDVKRTIAEVNKLSNEPVTPEAFEAKGTPDERTIALAEAGERLRLAQLWEKKFQLFMIAQNRSLTKPGGEPIVARRLAMEAVENFTPQERAAYQKAYDEYKAAERGQPLKSTALKTTQQANPEFRKDTDLVSALRRVQKTGTAFEKLLASRIAGLVRGIPFVVVNQNTVLPDSVKAEFARSATQGVYDPNTRAVYVRDSAFGDAHGINNTVILHEALHATTALKLNYALSLIERGSPVNKPMQFLVLTMKHAMHRANAVYTKAKEDGRSTPYLDALAKSGAFTDINEFVSYGFTDNVMQSFLSSIPGDIKGTSMWSRFVEAVRTMLGLGTTHQSALQDLMVTADLLMSQRLPANAQVLSTTPKVLNSVKKEGKDAEKKADKIRDPISHPEESLTTVGQLLKARSWSDVKDVVSDIYNGTASQFRRPLLGSLTTRQITDLKSAMNIVDGDGKPVLRNVLALAEDLGGRKSELLDATATLAKKWHNWQKKNAGKYRTLNRLIHLSTINQIDPSVDTRSKTLNEMYESLGTEGKALYNEIRDFYKDRFLRYKDLMLKRIENSGAEDKVKANLIRKLEEDFAKMPTPYFPLVREGKYWLRIGNPKSSNMEYYMFEDPRERNFYARQRAKELGTTVDAMMADDSNMMGMGDDYKPMINEGMRSSKMLNDVVKALDEANFSAATEAEAATEKARLRDDIYQLYLTTLPEQNFRKHFLHRKGTAGYRADALRNFAKSSFHTSVQLAKIEYGYQLRRELDRAWDATKGNPQRDTLFRPIIDEMRNRVENTLSPEHTNELATKLANSLGTVNFVYYMSAPASAITNLTGLFVFGVPVLNGEFGVKANAALAKNMNVFKSVGVTGKDGGYTFPTLLSKLEGRRRDAYMEALRRGKIDTTLTYDTLQLSRTPSNQYTGTGATIMGAIGYLFHHSEKLNREVMYMTSYDLAYDRAKTAGRDEKTAHEEAMNEASRLTDEAMFDYSEFNKPRFFRGNIARVIFQFKAFVQQTTYYLFKNFREMTKGMTPQERKAARYKFLGTLGMTGMFAGAVGMPLMSSIIFPIMGKILAAMNDEDDPDKRNPKLWFTKWLRTTFGDSLGTAIERGPVSWATNVDFHSRTKLDQLWFRDIKSGLSESEWLKELMVMMFGPTAGLGINVAKAMERIQSGQVERGIELLVPAGLRGFATAMRAKEEGMRTLKGDEIVPKEELSALDLWIIRSGFSPTKVAQINDRVSRTREVFDEVVQRHSEVFNMFKNAVKETDPETQERMFDQALEELAAYNKANPFYGITAKQVLNSVKNELEASALSVNGIRVPKKLVPLVSDLME